MGGSISERIVFSLQEARGSDELEATFSALLLSFNELLPLLENALATDLLVVGPLILFATASLS